MKKIAISQPRYLPAINYLQRLCFSDLFVFLDNVQRQARDFENRNKILISGKDKWITMPIKSSTREYINKATIDGNEWVDSHKQTLHHAYSKHPHYDRALVETYYYGIEKVLEESNYGFTETTIHLILNACGIFGFSPKTIRASSCPSSDIIKGSEKLVKIAEETGADVYVSGPNGREYGVMEAFEGSGIEVVYHDFEHPEYKQYGQDNFVPYLAFFDQLFNVGLERVRGWINKKPMLKEE